MNRLTGLVILSAIAMSAPVMADESSTDYDQEILKLNQRILAMEKEKKKLRQSSRKKSGTLILILALSKK
nr:hypothetical protein [Yersinia massiliensis]